MYTLLATFFISLGGIILMIGRKMVLSPTKHHYANEAHHLHVNVPDLEEVRYATAKGARKISYILIVVTLRSYLLSANLLKRKYQSLKNKIEKIRRSRRPYSESLAPEIREPNKFLKMISDYKKKISKIKDKIKEEEGLN